MKVKSIRTLRPVNVGGVVHNLIKIEAGNGLEIELVAGIGALFTRNGDRVLVPFHMVVDAEVEAAVKGKKP